MTLLLAALGILGTWFVGALALLAFVVAVVAVIALLAWLFSEDGMNAIMTLVAVGVLIWGLTYGAWSLGNAILH